MQVDPPPVGRWREPVIPQLPTSAAQVGWARRRPASERTQIPAPGEMVGLRLAPGGPVTHAQVVSVGMQPPAATRPQDELDHNVWRYKLSHDRRPIDRDAAGNREVELVDDPWPTLRVRTLEGPAMIVECREARLPGSAGWLRGAE